MEQVVDTTTRILDAAMELTQTRGFHGFSYADVAARVGIRNASIHYHFPTKADLGRELVVRYRAAFRLRLAGIERASEEPRRRLDRYARIYLEALLDGGRMCLCGMLAADAATLPPAVRTEVRSFFDENEAWLAEVLAAGRERGCLGFAGEPGTEARLLLAGLEGAMLVARMFGEPDRFRVATRQLLDGLEVAA